MRQPIFRTLAGLLAIGWVWATISKPPAWSDVPAFLGQATIVVMFVAYAVIGNRLASASAPVQWRRPEQFEAYPSDDQPSLHQPPDEG